jgi:hypothetical protein
MWKKISKISDKIPWPLIAIGSIILYFSGVYYNDAPTRESTFTEMRLSELQIVKEYLDESDTGRRKRNVELLRLYIPSLDDNTLNTLTRAVDDGDFDEDAEIAYDRIVELLNSEIIRIEITIEEKKSSLDFAEGLMSKINENDKKLISVNIRMIQRDLETYENDLRILYNMMIELTK